MSDAKDSKQANDWCEKVKKLLDHRTGKSKALKAAKADLKNVYNTTAGLLENLKLAELEIPSLGLHDALSKEYLAVAGRIEDGANLLDKDDSKLVAAINELVQLNDKITKATASEKSFNAKKNKFDKERSKRQIDIAKSKGLRGATSPGGPVRTEIENAEEHLQAAFDISQTGVATRSEVDIQTAIDMLTRVDKALEAARIASKNVKKTSKEDLEFISKWSELQSKVLKEIERLKALPGAEIKTGELKKLYEDAVGQLVEENEIVTGQQRACKKLEGYEIIVKAAEEESRQFKSKQLPDAVVKEWNLVRIEIVEYESIGSFDMAVDFINEAYLIAEGGRGNATGAIEKLKEYAGYVKEETTRATEEKKKAEVARTELDELIKELRGKSVPEEMLYPGKKALEQVDAAEFKDRLWSVAAQRYTHGAVVLKKLKEIYDKSGPEFIKKRQELLEITTLAAKCFGVPALVQTAQRIQDECQEISPLFRRFEIQNSIEAFDKARVIFMKPVQPSSSNVKDAKVELEKEELTLSDASKRLKELVVKSGVDLDDTEKLKKFREASNRLNDDVSTNEDKIRDEINKELIGFRGKCSAEDIELIRNDIDKKIEAVMLTWTNLRFQSPVTIDELEKGAGNAATALKKIKDDLSALLTKSSERENQLKALKLKREKELADAGPSDIEKRIKQAKNLGIDVGDQEKQFTLLRSSQTTTLNEYQKINLELEGKLEKYRLDKADKVSKVKDNLKTNVELRIRNAPIGDKFKKELETQVKDTMLLADSNDLDLLVLAEQKGLRMQQQLDAFKQAPEQHKKNRENLGKLGERIGGLKSKLPESNRRLQTLLEQEFVKYQELKPDDMSKRLALLENEVKAAEDKLKQRELDIADYRKKKQQIRDAYAAAKKKADTGFFDKAKAFEAWFEARFDEAHALKETESGIPAAMKVLAEVEKRVTAINQAENPEAKLRELDAVEVQTWNQMIDLARQWEKDVSYFLDTTLSKAGEAAKLKDDQEKKDLEEQIEGLADTAKIAGKLVAPYTKHLGKVTIGGAKGPDINKVRDDFKRARKMLADAQVSALRIIEGPLSTNVSSPAKGGLQKLLVKWRTRTQLYRQKLTTLAADIRKSVPSGDDNMKTAAEKAATMIEGLSSLFPTETFVSGFQILMEDVESLEKGEREKKQRGQLAAREDVLRAMRQLRGNLNNPLLRILVNKDNNPSAGEMVKAIAGLDVLLKEIELQALASA